MENNASLRKNVPQAYLLSDWLNPDDNVYGFGYYCYLVEARPIVANITLCCYNHIFQTKIQKIHPKDQFTVLLLNVAFLILTF